MKFHTPVELPATILQLTPQSRIMTVGSCFADHIGQRLIQCLPNKQVKVNPNGVLYNPGSIYNLLIDLQAPCFDDSGHFLFQSNDGLWHHWHYSTLFTAPSSNELTEKLQKQWAEAKILFNQLDALFITFSTDHAYYLASGKLQGTLVTNCHKQPARLFVEDILDPADLFDSWNFLLHSLHRQNPSLQIIFTLSPYRYAKYGLHENALSKARLLQLIDSLCRNHEHTHYFPAFEIITDELRDYRFYEPDMLHPSEQAIDYVWERFETWAFTPELTAYAQDRQQILRDLAHHPLHPESPEALRFKAKLEERLKLFEKKWGKALTD